MNREPSHDEWMALAEVEYARLDALLRTFSDDDWQRPTDCTEWDVREMVAHLVGAAESNARQREFVRQAWHGRKLRNGGPLVDGINAVQVRDRASVSGPRLVNDLREASRRGVRARRRLPAALRRVPLPFGPPLGTKPLGYLTDRIYTRDAWLHRVDLCRATDRELDLTAEHDGRIVADVVDEWARTHGKSYELTLRGPAGGRWSSGQAGEAHDLDAIEFCRIVSGRATGEGLLATPVPF